MLSQVQLAVESILPHHQGVLARGIAVLLDIDPVIAAVLMDIGVLPQAALPHHRLVAAARPLIDLHPVIATVALLDIHQTPRAPGLVDLDSALAIGLQHPHAVIGIVLLGDLGIEKTAALLDIRLVARRQLAALVQVHHVETAVLLDVGRIGLGPGGTGIGQQQRDYEGAGGLHGDVPCRDFLESRSHKASERVCAVSKKIVGR